MKTPFFHLAELPLGGSTVPATVTPRIERITSRDAAKALGIELKGHWHRRLRKEMLARGWTPFDFRHRGKNVRGYQRVYPYENHRP